MKKLFAIVAISLLLHFPMQAQSFLAGIWGVNDFYTDVQPDTVLQLNHDQSYNIETFPIDMNGDQIDDYLLQVEDNGSNHSYEGFNCVLIPFGNNQIARERIDSCYSDSFFNNPYDYMYSVNMAKAFSYHAVLQNHQDWIDSSAFLLFSRRDVDFNYPIGYQLHTRTFDVGQSYLGVRLLTGNDTLYGWIGVFGDTTSSTWAEPITSYHLTDFAISWGLTAITPNATSTQLQVMPNPANDVLRFNLNEVFPETTTLFVYDLAGREVGSYTIPAGTKNYNLVTSQWPSGMYFFHYQNQTGKFQVVHE